MKLMVLVFIALLVASCSSPRKRSNPGSRVELPTTDEALASVCPNCGTPISSAAVRCPACGEQFPQPPPPAPTTKSPYSGVDLRRQGFSIDPPSAEEFHTAQDRLSSVRSDMPVKQVLATLGLSRFRGHAKACEGPTSLGLQLDLAREHTMVLYYERRTTSTGWALYYVSIDETFWYPAEGKLREAAYSGVDGHDYGQPILTPVRPEELASARERFNLLKPEMKLRQVLATLELSRFRGHFIVGAGSISFSPHCDLGNGHKLDLIYNWIIPPYPPSAWKLSWVGIDSGGDGAFEWSAPDEVKSELHGR